MDFDAYPSSLVSSFQHFVYKDEIINEYEASNEEDPFDMFLQDSIINDIKLDLDTIYFIRKCPTSYGSDLAYVKDNSMNNNVKIDEE